MRTWFVLVMMAAVALSGCAGEGTGFEPTSDPIDDGTGGNETVDSVDTGDAGEAAENGTETVENLVPVLNVTTSALSGAAPLVVNFTIAAEDDSDALSWMLLDGDDVLAEGNEVPATAQHTFELGEYLVVVSLSDGEHTVTQNLSINATEPVEAFEPVSMEQAILGACPHCIGSDVTSSSTCAGFLAGEQGIDCWWFEVDPSWIGRTITIDGGFMMGIEFETSCDGEGTVVGSYLSEQEVIPEGTGCIFVLDIVDPVITAKATIA